MTRRILILSILCLLTAAAPPAVAAVPHHRAAAAPATDLWSQLIAELQQILAQLETYVAGAAPPPATTPTPAPVAQGCTPSANLTEVTDAGPAICDGAGNAWAITPDRTITLNGAYSPETARVVEIAYVNGVLWQENQDQLWWSYTSGTWLPGEGTSVSPLGATAGMPTPPPTSSSPPAGGFTIGAAQATPSGNLVNVNLTAPTGQQVTGSLYGVSMSTSAYTFNASFNDPGWVSAMAKLDLRFVRLHLEGVLADRIFPSKGSAGDFSVLDPLAAKLRVAFPHATVMVTVGWLAGYFYDDGWSSEDQSILAQQVTQLARYFQQHGIQVTYWDLFNEPDIQGANGTQGTTTSAAIIREVSGAAYRALAAVDPTYQFGSSPTADSVVVGDYVEAAVAAYPALNIWDGHWYGGGDDLGTEQDLAWGQVNPNAAKDYSALHELANSGYPASPAGLGFQGRHYPVSLNEYGLDYNGVSQDTHHEVGAIFVALLTSNGVLGNYLFSTAIWDGAQASFGFPCNGAPAAPLVHFLSRAGRSLPGNIVAANTGAPELTVLATTSGVLVINASQGETRSGAVAIAGLGDSTLHAWRQTEGDPEGTTMDVSATQLANQTFPPLSITIYAP